MAIQARPCKRCKGEIPPERLEAVPGTSICVRCSQEIGGEFRVTAVPERTGKIDSIKRIYGGWTVRKTRREIYPKED